CIAEALIYEYHPQIDSIKNFMLERKARLKQLIAEFSFPPQKNENFRNYYALGGGAINDLGSYATSIGRIFFGGGPLHSTFQLTDFHPETSVDTSFSVMEQYENGQGYIGAFGFNTQYRNRVSFLCDKLVIDVDRIFTTETTSHNTLFKIGRAHV